MADDLELNSAERLVIAAAETGEWANLGDLPEVERVISAQVIHDLAIGARKDWPVHHKGVRVIGATARIVGLLDLEDAEVTCPLWLFDCTFDNEIVLRGARTKTVSLQRCEVPGIQGDRLRVAGGLFLRNGFTATGGVRLVGAQIEGNLECGGGTFANDKGPALSGDGAVVKGGVFLNASGDHKFSATGGVRFLGARIEGNLECGGGTFTNDKGDALYADGMVVKGSVFLDASGGHKFSATGGVRLLGARIDGDLICDGGSFTNDKGDALNADKVVVTGSVYLNASGDHKFSATGEVRLGGARIGGQLNCRGGTFAGGLTLEHAEVADALMLYQLEGQPKYVNLTNAKAGALADDPASWPARSYLKLDGFVYDRISSPAPLGAEDRIPWLDLQPQDRFRPQPYEQLIKVLREMGHGADARKIGIAKEIALRRLGGLSPRAKAWNRFLEVTIAYGYQPWRAFYWMPLFIGLLWPIFNDACQSGVMVPAKERLYVGREYPARANFCGPAILTLAKVRRHWRPVVDTQDQPLVPDDYPRFVPLLYTLDVLLPIVDLHQEAYWQPSGARGPWGVVVLGIMWFAITFGWMFTTAFVAGFTDVAKRGLTGIVKKD